QFSPGDTKSDLPRLKKKKAKILKTRSERIKPEKVNGTLDFWPSEFSEEISTPEKDWFLMISTKLKEYLDSAGAGYNRHRHRAAYTSQQIAQAVHVPGRQMVKTVILKTDAGHLVMAVLSANDTANLDILREKIGCGLLRLASEAEFRDAFP